MKAKVTRLVAQHNMNKGTAAYADLLMERSMKSGNVWKFIGWAMPYENTIYSISTTRTGIYLMDFTRNERYLLNAVNMSLVDFEA
jgi:hypothetical protein